jgi:hypothetical protein
VQRPCLLARDACRRETRPTAARGPEVQRHRLVTHYPLSAFHSAVRQVCSLDHSPQCPHAPQWLQYFPLSACTRRSVASSFAYLCRQIRGRPVRVCTSPLAPSLVFNCPSLPSTYHACLPRWSRGEHALRRARTGFWVMPRLVATRWHDGTVPLAELGTPCGRGTGGEEARMGVGFAPAWE